MLVVSLSGNDGNISMLFYVYTEDPRGGVKIKTKSSKLAVRLPGLVPSKAVMIALSLLVRVLREMCVSRHRRANSANSRSNFQREIRTSHLAQVRTLIDMAKKIILTEDNRFEEAQGK